MIQDKSKVFTFYLKLRFIMIFCLVSVFQSFAQTPTDSLTVVDRFLGSGFETAKVAAIEYSEKNGSMVILVASNDKTNWVTDITVVANTLKTNEEHSKIMVVLADIQLGEQMNNASVYVNGLKEFVIGEQLGSNGLDLSSQLQLFNLLHESMHKVEDK